ncbi:MAG: Wzz/FepE/Etk N-terminal domain-containing protein [Candidatus Latescibacterota bacterium]|nr:Wzz/FepE/Etk N-terminal domain-containing protein [Candidatus Latescibacterota bacterium]
MEKRDRNLLEYVFVIVKWRRLIFWPVIVIGALSTAIVFILPKKWEAETTLIPVESDSSSLELNMLMGATIPGGLTGLLGQATPGERLITLLESRRVLGTIVDRFNLSADYGVESRELAIDQFRENVKSELTRDGALVISVEASTAEGASDMANALGRELDYVNRENQQVQASELAGFLEERMQSVQEEIEENVIILQRFQQEKGIVDVSAQTSALFELTQRLVQELALLEVKLGVASRRLHPDHEERQLLQMEIDELRSQLFEIVGSDVQNKNKSATYAALGPSIREWPILALEYAQLVMELKVDEQVLAFLAAQLEDAKLSKAQDIPTLNVLDPAIVPEIRSAPNRALILIISVVLTLTLSVILIFIIEAFSKLSEENRINLTAIRDQLKR